MRGGAQLGPVPEVDLLVPVKPLAEAKSRLRGAADGGVGDQAAHARLAVALATDTVAVARTVPGVRRVFAITSDPQLRAVFAEEGVAVLDDRPRRGLNAALRHGAEELRRLGRPRSIGALQADLPALRGTELAEALAGALLAFRTGIATRAFCADARGEGTTLLVCAPHAELAPRFGPGSAEAHERAGCLRLTGDWPGLRQDVDTPEDLWRAAELGVGPATSAALGKTARPRR